MTNYLSHLNFLLKEFEIPVQVGHLTHASPLLWTYLAESLLQTRLRPLEKQNINETIVERLQAKYALVRSVLEVLGEATGINLDYLGVDGIVGGKMESVEGLMNVFWELYKVLK